MEKTKEIISNGNIVNRLLMVGEKQIFPQKNLRSLPCSPSCEKMQGTHINFQSKIKLVTLIITQNIAFG